MKDLWQWVFNPPVDGPRSTTLIRFLAGGVFLSERDHEIHFPKSGSGAVHVAWFSPAGCHVCVFGRA